MKLGGFRYISEDFGGFRDLTQSGDRASASGQMEKISRPGERSDAVVYSRPHMKCHGPGSTTQVGR